MFEAFSINYISGLIIPVEKIGSGIATAIGLKSGKFGHDIVRIFIINAIFVTIISFTIALINCGLTSNVFNTWLNTYPTLHIVGFITSLLIEKPCKNLAKVLIEK